MPVLTVGDLDIYYESHGPGRPTSRRSRPANPVHPVQPFPPPPLLLIAGLGYGLWQWHKMLPGLAARYRVILFDNRGAGRSGKPPGPYSVGMLAADTAGLLDALGLGPAVVVGHSMGGFVAQELALSYPDRVSHLVLAATNFGGPNHVPVTAEALAVMLDRTIIVNHSVNHSVELMRRAIAVATAPGFAQAQPSVMEEWLAYRLANPMSPEQYQAQLAVGLGLLSQETCFEARLAAWRGPTLIIFGEHDKVTPIANAHLLQQAIPHSTVCLLPDAGHLFPLETPAAAVAAISDWLEQSAATLKEPGAYDSQSQSPS